MPELDQQLTAGSEGRTALLLVALPEAADTLFETPTWMCCRPEGEEKLSKPSAPTPSIARSLMASPEPAESRSYHI